MSFCRLHILNKLILFFVTSFIFGCSFHYDQGLQLEQEKRWAEAAIEYRIALVENPEDTEIREALKRMNIHVAQENFEIISSILSSVNITKLTADWRLPSLKIRNMLKLVQKCGIGGIY